MAALKRIWAAYKRYREIVKFISAIIGVIAGISACILFAKKYHNYHAAGWAAFSAVCALFFLQLVISFRRDIERKINPDTFIVYMVFGSVGALTGLTVFITYVVIGVTHHESGSDPTGSYVASVWGILSFKWSFFAIMSARAYRKKYLAMDGENTMIVNS